MLPPSPAEDSADIISVEVAGYAARAAAQDQTDALAPYIAQYLLILVSPALLAASVYMILGRVIRSSHGERHSLIKPALLTKIFVIGDIISFIVQIGGGSLQSMKSFDKNIAEKIVLGGLVFQIIVFGVFTTVAIIWHRRMKTAPTAASLMDTKCGWERIMLMLYSVSILIIVRSIFRVIEYAMGRGGYLLQHEWTMYVFDSALMVIAVFLFAWWYPGYLQCPVKDKVSEFTNEQKTQRSGGSDGALV